MTGKKRYQDAKLASGHRGIIVFESTGLVAWVFMLKGDTRSVFLLFGFFFDVREVKEVVNEKVVAGCAVLDTNLFREGLWAQF